MWHNLLLMSLLMSSRNPRALVSGGSSTVVLGDTATLPCKKPDTSEALTQISWQRRTRANPLDDNFYVIDATTGPRFVNGGDNRFTFVGNIDDIDGTIQLSNVTLMDEGTYTCIITLFPSGNHRREMPLRLLVPPSTSLEDNPVILGDEEVFIANCTAAGSKPPAEVRWNTSSVSIILRTTSISTQHENGTATTVSSLFGKPSRDINGGLVQCVITAEGLTEEKVLPLKIQVHFSPVDVSIMAGPKDSFECKSEANPSANITWKRSGKSLPQSARVQGAVLQFSSLTSDLTGLYQCEARNQYGRSEAFFYVYVSEVSQVGWVLFGLLLVILIGIGAWKLYQSGKWRSCLPGEGESQEDPRPPTSAPADPSELVRLQEGSPVESSSREAD